MKIGEVPANAKIQIRVMKGEKKFSGVLLPEEQPLELVPQDGKVHVGLASGQGFCIFCPNK